MSQPYSKMTLLSEEISLLGELDVRGPLHVRGRLEGVIQGRAADWIEVHLSGQIFGKINSLGPVVISGRVVGDLISNAMVILKPTATVYGNITTRKLIIEPGAFFEGEIRRME